MDPYNGAYPVEQIGSGTYLIEDGGGSTLAGYSVMSSDSDESIDPNGTNTDSGGDTNYYWPT